MTDVARLAGVSYQTVSRVLHDSPLVRGDTRERVLAAIRELDYRPNSVARALVTGRSKTLGVVTIDTTFYGPASTLLGIEQAAHDAGYAVSISSLRSLNRDTVLAAIEQLRNQGVDGVAVIAPLQAGVDALRHVKSDFSVVAVAAGPNASIPIASVDQVAGAAAATRHLLSLGHKTVWHLAGPPDWKEAEERVEGWRAELQAAGAPVPKRQLAEISGVLIVEMFVFIAILGVGYIYIWKRGALQWE
jgi:DNA-binding LacI/PurR family transcriptional regulator